MNKVIRQEGIAVLFLGWPRTRKAESPQRGFYLLLSTFPLFHARPYFGVQIVHASFLSRVTLFIAEFLCRETVHVPTSQENNVPTVIFQVCTNINCCGGPDTLWEPMSSICSIACCMLVLFEVSSAGWVIGRVLDSMKLESDQLFLLRRNWYWCKKHCWYLLLFRWPGCANGCSWLFSSDTKSIFGVLKLRSVWVSSVWRIRTGFVLCGRTAM